MHGRQGDERETEGKCDDDLPSSITGKIDGSDKLEDKREGEYFGHYVEDRDGYPAFFLRLIRLDVCDWEYVMYLMSAWVICVKQSIGIAVDEERYTCANSPKHCEDQEGCAENFAFTRFARNDATDERED